MAKKTRILVLAAALGIAMPLSAGAQVPPQHGHGGGPRGAPAARPAAPHVAAPRMAAPQAPRMAAPHAAPAPRMAAPRMAAPHVAAPRMAAPHVAAPARNASPRFTQQRMAGPRHQPAAANRAAQRQQQVQQRQQQRALRQQAQPAAQARTSLQAQSATQSRQNTRQQQRAERNLRRAENRELGRLPVSQRAQRRQEIQNARQQRALGRQQLAQPNAAPNAQALRGNRRNGAARLTADAARQGRFASRFAQQAGGVDGRNRFWNVAARNAWRHGHRARFVAWFGPVFWPYAYSDIFDYTFWPYGYDDGYWAYAYDDFFDGIFWGEAGPPADYAYAPPSGGRSNISRPSYASVQELCRQPGSGVTAWPFADIERKVGLNADQRQLLDDVRRASQDAAAEFKASCPQENAFPLTPPGRLAAMTARLDATLQTVQTVRPALEKFYDSLSDEQKERFNQIGPKNTAANAEASVASQAADTCKQPKQGLSNLPIEKIEDALNPTDTQEAELNRLQDATNKAVSTLQAACPDETPITPPGRLAAMEKRLQAMIDAANTVKPALESFYASLTSEQKARFNRIGQQLSQNNG
jgi:LTXXQ motif family protein